MSGSAAPPLERPRVLVLDEAGTSPGSLVDYLERFFELQLGQTGPAGMRLAQVNPPELILLRLGATPSALATLDWLMDDPLTADVPVVVLAAARDTRTAVHCLNRGASDFVARFSPDAELVARIGRAIRAHRHRRALVAQAQTDALTGLANYGALTVRLESEFKRARRYEHALSVVMLDLDYLKQINDRFGHETGNRVLLALARHLKANLRETDFAARYGGDEFVAVLPFQAQSEGEVFAQRVRAGLASVIVRPEPGSEQRVPVSVSVGVAEHSSQTPRATAGELLQAADAALYEFKRRSRGPLSAPPPAIDLSLLHH